MKWSPPQPGRRAQANMRARAALWQRVLSRAHHRCEGCGNAGVTLQFAHVMGRPGSGAALGEWANSVELTMALCASDPATGYIGCHPKYDQHRDPGLRVSLLSAALWRLWDRLGDRSAIRRPPWVKPDELEDWVKTEIRAAVRELEEAGVKP